MARRERPDRNRPDVVRALCQVGSLNAVDTAQSHAVGGGRLDSKRNSMVVVNLR